MSGRRSLDMDRRAASLVPFEERVFARYGLRPQTRQVRLSEPELNLRAVEVGSGEPVLFMHGISLTTAHWAPLIARLGPLRCLAIDMPGHGESDGVDFRGVDAPERVRSLVALGTPAVAFGAHPDPTLRMLALRGVGPLTLAMPNPQFAYRRILAMSLGREAIAAAPPELVRATYLATRRPGFARTVSTYLREQFRGASSSPQRYVLGEEELARVRRPVLVVWGEQDDRYQPVEEGRRRTALMPNARFELAPGGHEPWLDDVETCAKPIAAFVADNTQRR